MNVNRFWLALALAPSLAVAQGGVTAYPAKVTLDSGVDAHRLVVVRSDAQGMTVDVSAAAKVSFSKAGVAQWRDGQLLPVGDGETVATVEHEGHKAQVQVSVHDRAHAADEAFWIDQRHQLVSFLRRDDLGLDVEVAALRHQPLDPVEALLRGGEHHATGDVQAGGLPGQLFDLGEDKHATMLGRQVFQCSIKRLENFAL